LSNWTPGAFTPARCKLWKKFNPQGKSWLIDDVMREAKGKVKFPAELPPVPDRFWIDKEQAKK